MTVIEVCRTALVQSLGHSCHAAVDQRVRGSPAPVRQGRPIIVKVVAQSPPAKAQNAARVRQRIVCITPIDTGIAAQELLSGVTSSMQTPFSIRSFPNKLGPWSRTWTWARFPVTPQFSEHLDLYY
jgi:hypothetical protein